MPSYPGMFVDCERRSTQENSNIMLQKCVTIDKPWVW